MSRCASTHSRTDNFLDAMLLARDAQGRPFADQVIYGNMLTMLLAGEDTTAYTLSWALHQLCERPDLIARARIEIDAALGSATTPASFEATGKLPFIDAIVNETMRLCPVAPVQTIEAKADAVVAGVEAPRGTFVVLLGRLPARDSRNFHDGARFLPERWLSQRDRDAVHTPSASMPFGFGPRICPGRTLALVEMRIVLATLLKNFDLERVGRPEETSELFRFTMSPKALRIRLKRRVERRAERPGRLGRAVVGTIHVNRPDRLRQQR